MQEMEIERRPLAVTAGAPQRGKKNHKKAVPKEWAAGIPQPQPA